jgi:phosphotriesterase-related protein
MSTVNTLRGPIDATQIGTALMHEHIMARNPELEQNIEHPPRSSSGPARA